MNLNDAKTLLKDYAQDLEFEEAFGFILVKFKAFVSKDLFDKVYALVREADGEYVSAHKDSHFRLPGEKPETKPSVGKLTQTKDLRSYRTRIEAILNEMKQDGY